MSLVFDSYRFFTAFRMTTKRKRVILNAVKNLYTPPAHSITIENTLS